MTATPDFYVRCHGPIPALDQSEHRLTVSGLVNTPLDMTVAALRSRFPSHTVTAVLQCAGNRRADLAAVRPVSGDLWQGGAIGCADWTGIRLADLLTSAGVRPEGRHIAFTACDDCETDGQRYRYEASIPLAKAMAPETLIARSMNGETLSPAHGFPLRVIVPGFAGARSVKWLSRITVLAEPTEAIPQARDYKLFPADVTAETADWDRGVTINGMPLNAMICEPANEVVVPPGAVLLRGYAVAGDRTVTRVDVSADGGCHWRQARMDGSAPWAWTFWDASLDLPPGRHELVVRALDSAGQTQPADLRDVWNFKGYLCSAWHRVRVTAA